MRFTETPLAGAHLVEVDQRGDARGFFGRAWCKKEFEAHGLIGEIAQANIGFSLTRGTLRGLHYQVPPYEEVKLVRCTIGTIYDVIVDLRRDSPTYRRWFGIELTAQDRRMLYVPRGCAHGYQTLADDCEVFYLTSQFYAPQYARGVRYDDPAFGIVWPTVVGAISDADRAWPMHEGQDGNCETSEFNSTVNASHQHGGKT
jgi:dTDP-4-dehydrorhamnose 3,5-epimerase